jgi:hypothetical protein
MMHINVLADYGFDLSDQDTVRNIAIKLPSVDDAELVLDLSGCVLDYPATSLLIDAAITRLQAVAPPRRLELKFNIPFPPRVFDKWFFFGSTFLPKEYQSLSSDELRAHLVSAMKERQTTIVITRFDAKSGGTSEPVIYG